MMNYKEYWTQDSLKNIVAPSEFGKFPEGWDVISYLADFTNNLGYNSLVDFGCAYGRLASSFPSEKYHGIDLNPHGIESARKNNPNHTFSEVDIDSIYPKADLFIAYTVFLHLDDDTLRQTLKRIYNSCQKNLIIAEILGRVWRCKGKIGANPNCFNRDLNDYITILKDEGFSFKDQEKKPYEALRQDPRFTERDTDISFLIFEKRKEGNK